MAKRTTLVPQPGAARSLASVAAAEAYLAQHPIPGFVDELRFRWEQLRKDPPREPLPNGARKKFRRLARAALGAIEMDKSHRLYQAIAQHAHALDLNHDPKAEAFWRRLTSEPKDTRLALVLAVEALRAGDYFECEQYRVTGALAAAFAVALGVERPLPWGESGERPIACVKKWEKKMARARRYAHDAWGADS